MIPVNMIAIEILVRDFELSYGSKFLMRGVRDEGSCHSWVLDVC